jgi:hypothetical protein
MLDKYGSHLSDQLAQKGGGLSKKSMIKTAE